MNTTESVTVIAQTVMRGVAATGAVTEANIDRAIEVMWAEIKLLIGGEEYADERAGILNGTVSERTVLASVVASCVQKMKAAH